MSVELHASGGAVAQPGRIKTVIAEAVATTVANLVGNLFGDTIRLATTQAHEQKNDCKFLMIGFMLHGSWLMILGNAQFRRRDRRF